MTDPYLHLNRLARRLNAASSDGGDSDERSEMRRVFDALQEVLEKGVKFALMMGVAAIFVYLAVSIHYFPSGLTLADSFFFLLAGVLFGVGYVFLLAIGFIIALVLRWLYRNHKSMIGMSAAYFVAYAVLLASFWARPVLSASLVPQAISFVIAGFGLLLLIEAAQQRNMLSYMIMLVMLMFVPLLVGGVWLRAINEELAMGAIGIRTHNATLKLSDENFNILASAVGGQHAAALGCDAPSGASGKLVHGVNILWHGVGERSLVEVPNTSPAGSGLPNLTVELKREGLFVFRNYSGIRERCIELSGDVLFKIGASSLTDGGENELARLLEIIEKGQEKIAEIEVVGHADPVAFGKDARKNDDLALRRAQAIAERVKAHVTIEPENVKVESRGAREPKTLCKDWPVKRTLPECLAGNRRVELRIKLKD